MILQNNGKAPTVNTCDLVYHIVFGYGVVTAVNKSTIKVSFLGERGDKPMMYPQAFDDGFLFMTDGKMV